MLRLGHVAGGMSLHMPQYLRDFSFDVVQQDSTRGSMVFQLFQGNLGW